VPARFKCDVHKWMGAYAGVLNHPFFAVTDKDGKFYFDLPVANVDYDFHFTKPGYQQFDVRIHPNGPSTFNYVLRRG